MTGTALIALVRDLLGVPSDYSRLTDAEITSHVSEGAHILAEEGMAMDLRATATKTTTASQATLVITGVTNIVRILWVKDTSNDRLVLPVDQDARELQDASQGGTGQPLNWSLDSKDSSKVWTLRLHPTPDDAYDLSIRYVVEPTDISGSEITQFPFHMQHGLAHFAAWRHLLKLSENVTDDRRNEMRQEWEYHKNLYLRMASSTNPLGERQSQTAEIQRGLTQ